MVAFTWRKCELKVTKEYFKSPLSKNIGHGYVYMAKDLFGVYSTFGDSNKLMRFAFLVGLYST